jgi:hypothetical protein
MRIINSGSTDGRRLANSIARSPEYRTQIQDRVDLAHQVVGRNMALKLERVEQLFRLLLLSSHYRVISRIDRYATIESPCQEAFKASSSTVYPDSAGTRTNRLPKREIGILLTE